MRFCCLFAAIIDNRLRAVLASKKRYSPTHKWRARARGGLNERAENNGRHLSEAR